jgi:hypothetical protein
MEKKKASDLVQRAREQQTRQLRTHGYARAGLRRHTSRAGRRLIRKEDEEEEEKKKTKNKTRTTRTTKTEEQEEEEKKKKKKKKKKNKKKRSGSCLMESCYNAMRTSSRGHKAQARMTRWKQQTHTRWMQRTHTRKMQ